MKIAKFSKPRDTGTTINSYSRPLGLDEDTTGNSSLEYAYFVIGLFLIAPIARQKTANYSEI